MALTYPAFYRAASGSSKAGQSRYLYAVRIRLAALVAAAFGGALSWNAGGVEVFAWVALVGFVVALAAEVVILASHPERQWYEGRAAAESAKTLSWRYAVGGDPFPAALDETAAREAFLAQLSAVARTLQTSFPAPAPGGTGQITPEMTALRGRPFPDRKAAYLDDRVEDQRRWYETRARESDRRHHLFLLAAIGLEFGGVVAATLRVADVIHFDLLGIIAALVAGVAAWVQTRQYGSTARAYAVASNELATIHTQAASVDEAGWPRFVAEAEEAVSREHTLWTASRGGAAIP